MNKEYKTVPLTEIRPYPNNPRINDAAAQDVAKSIEDYGIPEDSVLVEDKYIVTRNGDIYRICKKCVHPQAKRLHSNGYLRGVINGKDVYIHRIVAECFIPNSNGYLEVNHKDGNKHNNTVDNLEWCTRSENNRHAFQTGLRDYAELKAMARMPRKHRRFSKDDILEIRKLASQGHGDKELAEKYGCHRGEIWQIKTGKVYKDIAV